MEGDGRGYLPTYLPTNQSKSHKKASWLAGWLVGCAVVRIYTELRKYYLLLSIGRYTVGTLGSGAVSKYLRVRYVGTQLARVEYSRVQSVHPFTGREKGLRAEPQCGPCGRYRSAARGYRA